MTKPYLTKSAHCQLADILTDNSSRRVAGESRKVEPTTGTNYLVIFFCYADCRWLVAAGGCMFVHGL